MITEKQATANFLLRTHKEKKTMFRNNNGVGLTLDGRDKIKFGLGKGTSDYVGWTRLEITPDMVGKIVAVFTAVEIKSSDGKLTESQKDFIDLVNKSGGIAQVFKGDNYDK